MNDDLQKRIQAALASPQNMGEMAGADSVGTVGNADCGEMLRLWVKLCPPVGSPTQKTVVTMLLLHG